MLSSAATGVKHMATSAALLVPSVLMLVWVAATVWALPWDQRPRGGAKLVQLLGWRGKLKRQ